MLSSDRAERLRNLSAVKRALLISILQKEAGDVERASAIPRRKQFSPVPMSHAQQRLWFLNQMEPDTPAYNVAAAVRLTGRLDTQALTRSINEVVRRHEALRTTFRQVNGQPVQVISQGVELELEVSEVRGADEREREARVRQEARGEAERGFDLERGPLLRGKLLRLSDTEHVLILITHHIVADGWSLGVLVKEVGEIYGAYSERKGSELEELRVQYADYAAWQREWMKGEALDSQLSYWKQKLSGNLPVLELPLDHPRQAARSYKGATQSLSIPKDLTEELKSLAKREKATLFMTLLAAYEVLLYRYTNQEDLIIGTPVANRGHHDLEGLIGNFVNMLTLRTSLTGNPTFRELLARVREVAWEAYAHQEMPFEKLVEVIQPERSLAQAPLFQVTFVFQNMLVEQTLELPELTVRPFDLDIVTPQYDFTLTIWEGAEDLTARLSYKADLFDADTINRILGNYEAVLRNVVKDPDARLKSIDMTAENEKLLRKARDMERNEADLKKLFSAKPKPVNLAQGKLVTAGYLAPDSNLPLVLRPGPVGVDLSAWAAKNLDYLEREVLKHGAILFRDFNVDSVDKFDRFVRTISPELFDYKERSSPRTELGNQIYTSTDHPADQWIQMHSEHTYSHQWPMKLWFCCIQPAQSGGETPIASNREVIKLLGPEIVEQFRRKKIMYVRNYGDGLGVPWQTAFQTTDPGQVQEYCRAARIDCEWKDGDRLRTWQVREAVVAHPRSGELSWFNHTNIYNVASMGAEVQHSLMTMFKEEDLPFNTYYGDGSPIEADVLTKVRAAYTQAMTSFPWQKGDVLMLDNVLVAHGRSPYAGPRKIVVAMGDLFTIRGS